MKLGNATRFTVMFVSILSILGTPPMNGFNTVVPSIRANPAPTEAWYPAGPAANSLQMNYFLNPGLELTSIAHQNPEIDLTDAPIIDSNEFPGSTYFVTNPPGVHPSYYEIEFNLALGTVVGGASFWGCNMNFGNSVCGKEIRQGISHLIDKNVFVSNHLSGFGSALDSPVLPNRFGFPTSNPCAWDNSFPETGGGCKVGGPGGVAYHLAAAAPGSGCSNLPPLAWMPGCGTPDFCAAATHFVAAGLATSKNPSTCVLTGISSNVGNNRVNFFIRNDNYDLQLLGESIQQEACALFTGQFGLLCSEFGTPAQPLNEGPIGQFPGLVVGSGSVNLAWGMYTAGVGSQTFTDAIGGEQNGHLPDPFDTSLFFSFNSRLVSGVPSIKPPNGPCSNLAIASLVPSNYVYMCVASYDIISTQMEFAPCLSAQGDPATGQTTPTFANCPSSTQLSMISAGYKAEDQFGMNAFTIPVWYPNSQFGYLSSWQRVINSYGGIANFFTYLDAHSTQSTIIRQGVSNEGVSLNPYFANTFSDALALGGIYDTLHASNPTVEGSDMEWMTIKTDQLPASGLSYVPPSGTVAAYRYTLRNDIYFQSGDKVTSFDVAFSYLSMMETGAAPATIAMGITGITVLSPTQMDLDVNAVGPFTKLYLSGLSILPGLSWSNDTAAWRNQVTRSCGQGGGICFNAQYTLSSSGRIQCSYVCTVQSSTMEVDTAKVLYSYDPLAQGILIGSGPWMCKSSGPVGTGCSSTGTMFMPAGSTYTLQRYGLGTVPGGSLNTYFRSAGNLALWAYSGDRGNFGTDFLNFGQVSLCFGKPVGTAGCTVWQHGIGGSAAGTIVGLAQVSIVQRFVGVNWVAPYDWTASPPSNIASFPPVLYEGTITLNPCSIDPTNGYDC